MTFTVEPKSGTKHQRLFVGTSSEVSPDPTSYLFSITSNSSASLSTSIDSATFHSNGITSGYTAYIVAYAEGAASNAYVDFATGRSVFPDLNPIASNVVTVVVP